MNIGVAVQETRKDLVYRRDRYFGTPVLYMQTRVDGGLVKQVAGETEGTRKSEITGKRKSHRPSRHNQLRSCASSSPESSTKCLAQR